MELFCFAAVAVVVRGAYMFWYVTVYSHQIQWRIMSNWHIQHENQVIWCLSFPYTQKYYRMHFCAFICVTLGFVYAFCFHLWVTVNIHMSCINISPRGNPNSIEIGLILLSVSDDWILSSLRNLLCKVNFSFIERSPNCIIYQMWHRRKRNESLIKSHDFVQYFTSSILDFKIR